MALLTAACSGSGDGGDATAPTTAAAPISTVTTTAAATTVPDEPASELDPAATLDAALAAYADGYTFRSVAEVNRVVASVVEGRILGDASAFTVTSGDAAVEYIVSPEGRWVRSPGAEWNLLDGAAPQEGPLVALAANLGVEVVSVDGSTVVLAVSYPAAALGASGEDVVARLTVQDGRLVEVRYEISTEDVVAGVVTEFGPPTDRSPIIAPPIEG